MGRLPAVELALSTGDGSTQISPNHSFDVQVVELAVELLVGEGVCSEDVTVVVGSSQPNQPGCLHEVLLDALAVALDVVVTVGAGLALWLEELDSMLVVVVVVGSLQPNQPGCAALALDLCGRY